MIDADATIAEWEKEHPPDSAVEPEPVTPQTDAPAETVADEAPTAPPRSYSLDDVLPDDPRIPESMRGKPLAILIEDRRSAVQRALDAGNRKNAEHERAETYKTALETLARRIGPDSEVKPTPKLRPSDEMRQRGVAPETVYTDPAAAFDAVVDMARSTNSPAVDEQIKAAQARIQELENQRAEDAVRNAFMQAKPHNVSVEQWQQDGELLAFRIHRTNSNIFDPESYRQAAAWLDEQRGGARRAAPPAPVAPAPPVGNGNSAPVVKKAVARVNPHVRDAAREVTEVLNGVLSKTGSKHTADSLLEGMAADPKYREMFQ